MAELIHLRLPLEPLPHTAATLGLYWLGLQHVHAKLMEYGVE